MPSQRNTFEKKLKALERELWLLRQAITAPKKGKQRILSLEGIWKGIEISDKEISEARASLFPSRF